ncbi:RNA polymerase sigma factor [Candidatus Poribacteria bacterium]|nr:RNA polymerase sigma factor [Candidatus Poribacteria bacterium]
MALADVPAELIERCQRGVAGAWDELFLAVRDDLFRWIYSLVRSEEDAQEILQDCCVRIFRHLPSLKDPARFGSWAGRMVINQVNTWRVRSRRTRLESLDESWEVPNEAMPIQGAAGPNPRRAASRAEVLRDVNRAIAELPPRQRTAVLLFDVKGWTIKEIAEKLGCSEGAVKFNIFQGRRKLRGLIECHVDDAGRPVFDVSE